MGFYLQINDFKLTIIVRITSDNPLVDPEIILSIDKQPISLDDVLNIINKSSGLLDINKNYIQNEVYLKLLNEDKKLFNK
jgi:hypothetical protein